MNRADIDHPPHPCLSGRPPHDGGACHVDPPHEIVSSRHDGNDSRQVIDDLGSPHRAADSASTTSPRTTSRGIPLSELRSSPGRASALIYSPRCASSRTSAAPRCPAAPVTRTIGYLPPRSHSRNEHRHGVHRHPVPRAAFPVEECRASYKSSGMSTPRSAEMRLARGWERTLLSKGCITFFRGAGTPAVFGPRT